MPMMAHGHSLRGNGDHLVLFSIIKALQGLAQAQIQSHGHCVEEDAAFANAVQVMSLIHRMKSEAITIEPEKLHITPLVGVCSAQHLLARWR